EAKDALLHARPDRGERHDEARDDRGVDARIVEPDENEVADEARQPTPDSEPNVLRIAECIRHEERGRLRRLWSRLLRAPHGPRDLAERSFHCLESWDGCSVGRRGKIDDSR